MRGCKPLPGRDYADVAPLKGAYRGTAKREMTVDVLVSRLEETQPAPATTVARATP
jgi:transglutaminase-like putative cysteine protease